MKVFNTILITLLSSFALHVGAANMLGESVEYMKRLLVGKKNIITVDLPDLPLREVLINKDEKDRAEDCLRRAFRCEEEGSAAKIREAVNLFHDAAQYGQPEACAAMEVFCKEGWYGLTPGRAAAYYERLKFWRSDIERAPVDAGAEGDSASTRRSSGGSSGKDSVGGAYPGPADEEPLIPIGANVASTRRSSGETTSGSTGDSSDGSEGAIAGAGLRNRLHGGQH